MDGTKIRNRQGISPGGRVGLALIALCLTSVGLAVVRKTSSAGLFIVATGVVLFAAAAGLVELAMRGMLYVHQSRWRIAVKPRR